MTRVTVGRTGRHLYVDRGRGMELQDYLRMLRRGWLTVVVVTAVGVGLASLYVAVAPRVFDGTTVLFVSARDPTTIGDRQQGAQFVTNAVVTSSEIIDSSTVLGPVAEELRLLKKLLRR